ncbi:MAG: colicin import rane protein [Pseudomonadota bacterium]|nr:colicin import rane protein [Pseudomonadota bacterium]
MRLTIASLLLLFATSALAQVDSKPMPEAERQEKLGRASKLKDEASLRQKEADALLKVQTDACHKKFLVSSCLEEAGKAHTQSVREAKRMDLEGSELERDVKRREVAAKDASKAAEAPKREAKEKAKGEAYRADEAAKAEQRAAKAAKKEKQAADGRRKHSEAQARHEKKKADQAKKDAKLAEKRRAREQKAAAREAEKAAKAAEKAAGNVAEKPSEKPKAANP